MIAYLPSLVALGSLAIVALLLSIHRPTPPGGDAARRAASHALAIATAVQACHFAEETATGFTQHLAALFDVPAMPLSVFVLFNLFWIAVWIAAVQGLRSSRRAAYFAAWFLALAGIVNGFAHPALALAARGYFPGLLTSPFIGIAGIFLWRRLTAATATAENGRRLA